MALRLSLPTPVRKAGPGLVTHPGNNAVSGTVRVFEVVRDRSDSDSKFTATVSQSGGQ